MLDPGAAVKKSSIQPDSPVAAPSTLLAGAIFGLMFGFLLQKGGVGKFNILIGQLLLQDFTVVKIMLTAIIVGMVGVFTLHHFAKVNLHIRPTTIGPNVIGGLVFGAGFALIGYCPGTAAAALGQGSWDALFGMGGLVAGSWVFAEVSGALKETVQKWGDMGKVPAARSAARAARRLRCGVRGAADRWSVRAGGGVPAMTPPRTRNRILPSRKITGASSALIVREWAPQNLEMPFGAIDGFLTPVEQFYVRSHFAVPTIDSKKWRLSIEGEVEKPTTLSLRDLQTMASVTETVTLECAGNGRAFLTPQAKGAQWERGAVGNATWTGVRLTDVLRRAGLKPSARELIFEGADNGEIADPPAPAGTIHYARSIPVAPVIDDVLVVVSMDGRPLTPAHGAPVRIIVPGWYGMASVKWLTRIIASADSFHGYYQTIDYAVWQRGPSAPTLVPVTEMHVKAQIARPGPADVVPAGQVYRMTGAAWTADADITKVEVSVDDGRTWHLTRLLGKPVRNAWRLWEYLWRVPRLRVRPPCRCARPTPPGGRNRCAATGTAAAIS